MVTTHRLMKLVLAPCFVCHAALIVGEFVLKRG